MPTDRRSSRGETPVKYTSFKNGKSKRAKNKKR